MSNLVKRETVEYIVIIVAFIIAVPLVFLSLPKKGDIIIYDCRLAEISPDYPLEVKEKCRKLRSDSLTTT
jgi:hypothetical protein